MALEDLEVRHATKRANDYKLADNEGLSPVARSKDLVFMSVCPAYCPRIITGSLSCEKQ